MIIKRWAFMWVACFLVLATLVSCAGLYGRKKSRYRSSVVEYLYPNKDVQEISSVPHLSLPLQAGIAFVPESTGVGASHLSEKGKMDLMDRVSGEFRKLQFIKDIEMIPSAYLTRAGSFSNLDQIKNMYGVDVMVLLSYDQVQHTDEGFLSVMYWTIVGAYIFRGEKNDTSTMIDAAVYDIASRKMLFRAPGLSHVKGSATIVNLTEQLRLDSDKGFRLAADDLVVNLKAELDRFKTKVKEMPQEYIVQQKPGYTGGGSFSAFFALSMLILGGIALWGSKNS